MDWIQGWASLPGGGKASVAVSPDGLTIMNTSGVTIPAGSFITIDSTAFGIRANVATDVPPLNEAGEPVPMPSIFDVRPGDRYHVPGRTEPVTVTRVFPPMAGDGGAVAFEDVYVLPVVVGEEG